MANFNLADYETVEERIARFYKDNPDGRIATFNLTSQQDRQVSTWVVKAVVYLTAADQELDLPKASGMAFEIDGAGMANKTSALENAETSAIGRALANAGYSGNKRATREEMEKVARDTTPKAAPKRDWNAEIDRLTDVAVARQLYNEARTGKAGTVILDKIKAKAEALGASPSA